MARPEKVAVVEELAEKFKNSAAAIFTDYRGLDVKAMTELRRRLRESGVEYKVVKNTLTLLAARAAEIEGVEALLGGPTAIAFDAKDPVAPAKVLSQFAKENDALEIKGGVLEGRVIAKNEVDTLANLPSREELLATVLMRMQGPIYGLVYVLQGTIQSLVYALEAIRREKEGATA
ncbi:MAG: 50S ribosomal protein L10 [Firmicutes bacterium]|nr:50S ribosomal protein L10 [Bacillota bacterium]